MQKAQLSSAQRGHSLVAGAVGHVLFSIGWLLVGFVVLGGGLTLIIGGSSRGLSGRFSDIPALNEFLSRTGDIIGVLVIVAAIVALIFITLGAIASGVILKRGAVRKPWKVTFQSLGIVALLDVPLFVVYLSIAAGVTDTTVTGPVFLGPVVGILGSAVVGALVWWWMAWFRRGSASTFAGVTATASATAISDPQN
ncbi:hypothetical protein [Salinibacterium sp. M195]|uniref:hypothetical protein n=1 Tax=Salinibacterium sp. M195 TaxID=2583374 RepID=UPI001C62D06B|nr:hypothetical protein [Salinibacterium sp. M195]QYH35800.1 hypothetical protein FFT87_07430 [Salinibacterium sp. M195]